MYINSCIVGALYKQFKVFHLWNMFIMLESIYTGGDHFFAQTDSNKYTSGSEMIVINKQLIFTRFRKDVFAKYGAMILLCALNDIMIFRQASSFRIL